VHEPAEIAAPLTLEDDEICQIVLSILLERHPALVAFEELAAEFPGPDTERDIPASVIHDAIDELVRLGLVYRLDRFVFASYAAVRARALGA
jgi:hypothetical protein